VDASATSLGFSQVVDILTKNPTFSTNSVPTPPVMTTETISNRTQPGGADSHTLALSLAASADERKGAEITILHVAEVSYLADYFVFVTAFSKPQVRAIAQTMEANAKDNLERIPRRIEGVADATWVLLDYGDVIAHVLLPREREYYNLEAFWGHAERIPYISASSGFDRTV
jgi:ribosome-associated protein